MVTRESFGKLVLHFFYDITHFDSKFFDTLRYLLFRPGFLSIEYMRGRRASYLNPIRMYIFTSALFFLIFFSMRGTEDAFRFTGNDPMTIAQRDSVLKKDLATLQKRPDDTHLRQRIELLSDTSRVLRPTDLLAYADDYVVLGTINGKYSSMRQYDSVQAAKKTKKDGWLTRLWNKRAIELNERYKYDPELAFKKVTDSVLHKLPYVLFVSLPFFALILRLLYIRRKEFYFADHSIFSVHHYILSFILLLFVFIWDLLDKITGWNIWNLLIAFTGAGIPIYLFLAMRRFYGQGRLKTFIKFFLLTIAGLFALCLILILFFLFSVFQI